MAEIDLRGVTAPDGTAKARIERAALALFTQRSIDGTSTKSITERAGVSEGLLFRHFGSKEKLARGMMIEIHTRLAALIETAANAELPEAIAQIVSGYCEMADDDWALFCYHIQNLHRFTNLSEDLEQGPLRAAASLLASAQKFEEIPRRHDPALLSAMALGIVLQPAQAKVVGALSGPLIGQKDVFTSAILTLLQEA